MNEWIWYVDPVSACLLGLLLVIVIVLISTDFLRIRIVRKDEKHHRWSAPQCYLCGEPWTGNHYCRYRK